MINRVLEPFFPVFVRNVSATDTFVDVDVKQLKWNGWPTFAVTGWVTPLYTLYGLFWRVFWDMSCIEALMQKVIHRLEIIS